VNEVLGDILQFEKLADNGERMINTSNDKRAKRPSRPFHKYPDIF